MGLKESQDYNTIQDRVNEYTDIWLNEGYKEEYTDKEGKTILSLFEMLDKTKEGEDYDEAYAADIFEMTLLQNSIGYQYAKRLFFEDKERFEDFVSKSINDNFWSTECGIETLSEYATEEEQTEEFFLSARLVKAMMERHILLGDFEEDLKNDYKKEQFDKLGNIINIYLTRHGYAHLPFWSQRENMGILYKYSRSEGIDSLEMFRETHDSYLDALKYQGKIDSSFKHRNKVSPKLNHRRFLLFENSWKQLNRPVEYQNIREEIVKKIKDSNYIESFSSVISEKNRKFPFLNILEDMVERVDNYKDEDAHLFLSSILFDSKLFHLVDSARMYASENEQADETLYENLLDLSFQNPKHMDWNWFRHEGVDTLDKIYENCPYLYLDIVKRYLDIYVNNSNLTDKEGTSIRKILYILFNNDIKGRNAKLYDYYSNQEQIPKNKKVNNIRKVLFGEFNNEIILNENMEFFESSEKWCEFFKDRKSPISRNLTKLYLQDEDLFLHIIESLIKNSSNPKEANYFDNVRVVNMLGKKLDENVKRGIEMLEDPLREEREEMERRIIEDAKIVCTPPPIKVTLDPKYKSKDFRNELLKEYLNEYSDFVNKLDLKNISIINTYEGISIMGSGIGDDLLLAIKPLGLEFEVEENVVNIKNIEYDKYLQRIIGILHSPTLYEWKEDDRNNNNNGNEKLRSLFFLPNEIEIEYSDDIVGFSHPQMKHLIQNYLPWYIGVKNLTGNIESNHIVQSAWLYGKFETKFDLQNYKSDIKDRLEKIWPETMEAFKVIYNYERNKRVPMLKKFLEATNIEEIVEMMDEDPIRLAMLSSSILSSTLNIGEEERVYSGVEKVIATLNKKFEGLPMDEYLSERRIEKVKSGLKQLGFQESDEGLRMFRNLWQNLWYLRGNRGLGQTITITDSGLSISNPNRNMFEKRLEQSRVGNEIVKSYKKQYDGGPDKTFISWKQISEINEVKFDFIPSKDLYIKIATNFATLFKKERPAIVDAIEKRGPADILLKLPGRDKPLCEIFAVSRPKEVWKLIKDFANLIQNEEGSENAIELLRVLADN